MLFLCLSGTKIRVNHAGGIGAKMAAVVNSDNFSDEEWLVLRAQSCIKTDAYAAKAWMITARSLFPQNFNIQVNIYQSHYLRLVSSLEDSARLRT